MPSRLTQQKGPDAARMRREVERHQQEQDVRLTKLEAMADYIRDDLYPYLVGLAAFVAYSEPPRPPS